MPDDLIPEQKLGRPKNKRPRVQFVIKELRDKLAGY